MKRRQFVIGTLLIGVGSMATQRASAQIVNLNDAINKAGRQRMLSQRLAKSYLQIGQSIDLERSRTILDTSLAMFDRQLVELKAFAPSPDNKATLGELEKVWLRYKEVLVGRAPNTKDAAYVMTASEEVLTLAHTATVQLEKTSPSSAGRLVNLSGRQRMLSQRMAKFYQAINWNIDPADAKGKLEVARKEFVEALDVLSGVPNNTVQIKSELELARQQWVFFENALAARVGADAIKRQLATNVATTSERILEQMDRITGFYEKLA
ncbi:type IV pili methyl-accepting chemotaxis transducer N-terminal domain-containing protein [Noviherbaspirillum sp. ST9]|uniref:type IV pili methyl-accepting chemotaxis transducer N-terminal domain-containing protein n=1 Tax=Noviherbaspirillum sp. ST9 TaxID=3401606 RepID=UPI003B58949A